MMPHYDTRLMQYRGPFLDLPSDQERAAHAMRREMRRQEREVLLAWFRQALDLLRGARGRRV